MANPPNASPCPNCNSRSLHWTTTFASAVFGSALLPGQGMIPGAAEVHVVVCTDCGLIRLFAAKDALKKLTGGKSLWVDWHKLSPAKEGDSPAEPS